ncbi:hypothetical protein ATANTOWER_016502 [Ataeniobius toweri]|uniref:Uncharacterized protein n=1 Tax=Ataeniobius toweri TaxID=208326 RepID=A0ABU7APV0_9TELE|nr:hypothetical protein [Ataeniobius toweri]
MSPKSMKRIMKDVFQGGFVLDFKTPQEKVFVFFLDDFDLLNRLKECTVHELTALPPTTCYLRASVTSDLPFSQVNVDFRMVWFVGLTRYQPVRFLGALLSTI